MYFNICTQYQHIICMVLLVSKMSDQLIVLAALRNCCTIAYSITVRSITELPLNKLEQFNTIIM